MTGGVAFDHPLLTVAVQGAMLPLVLPSCLVTSSPHHLTDILAVAREINILIMANISNNHIIRDHLHQGLRLTTVVDIHRTPLQHSWLRQRVVVVAEAAAIVEAHHHRRPIMSQTALASVHAHVPVPEPGRLV